jgi:sulfite reductase (ferredoxin)
MALDIHNLPDNLTEVVKEDLVELQTKIQKFKSGIIPEDKFKSFRLTRGVYGQRQIGVQMFRIKIPYGKVTSKQLIRIAELSDEYTNGNLHVTTRQNIQLHHIHLEDTPEMWAKLEEVGITMRESCGNTVRNITASSLAGIDPEELFDVSPYAEATFQYFLRNAVCQDMGRKIKIAFSSSDKDSAFTYFHDFGFIPRVKIIEGQEVRGFKTVIGGGLGAQPYIAETAFEFLPEDQVIPFIEASLRVFDRHGEREKRMKARLKFLLDDKKGLTVDQFKALAENESKGLAFNSIPIDRSLVEQPAIPEANDFEEVVILDRTKYSQWLKTNVFEQKQNGFFGVYIKLQLGDISAEKSKELASLLQEGVVADEIRFTVNQGILLKYARKEALPYIFYRLNHLELAEPGFGTIADITACPGTDTCNLAVTNSTAVSVELEKLIREEFPELITNNNIHIKISGCMNSCGQHVAANIGFHGSSIKHGELVVPALQVLLGGGVDATGKGFIAEKVIKLPTKKIPHALRLILNDYDDNANEGEYFNDYYYRKGKIYFYNLLKPLANLLNLAKEDYVDWGHSESFIPEIGTGECAGITYDVVGTIINDAEERLYLSNKAFIKEKYSDAVYHAYSSFVIGAKSLLLGKDIHCNTHNGIINDFQKHYYEAGDFNLDQNFTDLVLQINSNLPTEEFAAHYIALAKEFIDKVKAKRQEQVEQAGKDKVVVDNYYKA